MTSAALVQLWAMPGMSEFISAITGAAAGSVSAGFISWGLQREAFKRERDRREREKQDADRAALVQVVYACLRAVHDFSDFARHTMEARERALKERSALCESLWTHLDDIAPLPDPISLDAHALAVLVDHDAANLAMAVLSLAAEHKASIKLWAFYRELRRSLVERCNVEAGDNSLVISVSPEIMRDNQRHLKDVAEYAGALSARSENDLDHARDTLLELQTFIKRVLGDDVDVLPPPHAGRAVDQMPS